MPTEPSTQLDPGKKPPWAFFLRTLAALFIAPWLEPKRGSRRDPNIETNGERE